MSMKLKGIVGAVMLVSAATVSATTIDLVVNGGFETGDLSGWTVQNLASGGCGSNIWEVNTTGANGCSGNGANPVAPIAGSFAAYNTNDGPAGQLVLSQLLSFDSSVTSASISWLDQQFSHPERLFSIDLYDATNTLLLGNLFTHSASISPGAWESHSVSVSSSLVGSLAGTSATLRLTNNIPVSFSGPSAFGLDSVAFNVTTTEVPEPSSLAILGLGLAGLGWSRRKKA